MPKFTSTIVKTTLNGPYAYQFATEVTDVDGSTSMVIQDVVNNVQTAAAALDGIKAKVGALGGALLRANLNGETAA